MYGQIKAIRWKCNNHKCRASFLSSLAMMGLTCKICRSGVLVVEG